MPATPPITPPTIAPVFELEPPWCVGLGVLDVELSGLGFVLGLVVVGPWLRYLVVVTYETVGLSGDV